MGKMRHYYPDGMRMWDTWYLHLDGVTHLFHLQVRRAGGNRPDEDEERRATMTMEHSLLVVQLQMMG